MPSSHCGAAGLDGGSGRLQQQGKPAVGGQGRAGGGEVDHRPHLDRAVLGGRDVTRERQRLVEVVRLEHVVAARHLGALGERAVCDGGGVRPARDAHAGRRGRQRVACADRRGCLGVEVLVCRHLGRALLGREFAFGADQQGKVVHRRNLSCSEQNPVFHSLPVRRTGRGESDSRSVRAEMRTWRA